MGTRGTLHVYVNGELKIRQYNQWDSYPTGQFEGICEYFRENKEGLKSLVYRLLNSRLSTKDEINSVINNMPLKNLTQDYQIRMLINRDIGSDILYLLTGMPIPYDGIVIPDWMHVHDEDFPKGEDPMKVRLSPQEGNYVIEIECKIDEEHSTSVRKRFDLDTPIRVRLSGEFWGIERSYDWDYIPTDKEIEEWEEKTRNRRSD